jgi:hypothetical protein
MDKNPESSAGLYTAQELLTSMSLIFFVIKPLNKAIVCLPALTNTPDIGTGSTGTALVDPCEHAQATTGLSRIPHDRIG